VTARRWLAAAGLVVACTGGAAATRMPAGPALQPRPTPAGRASLGEPGPLEQVAVAPSLDAPAPRRKTHVAPEWPSSAAATARYRVHLVIDAAGHVVESRIVAGGAESSDVAADTAAVLTAVRQWTFEPPARAPMLMVTYVDRSEAEGMVVPSATGRRPIRIGSGMRPPAKIHHVSPEYPVDARNVGLSGVVILEATIDAEGHVSDVHVVRGVPGLDDAATAAVLQWRYAPTLLNGEAVPVIMTVTVNFQP
jgi:TonB family protein